MMLVDLGEEEHPVANDNTRQRHTKADLFMLITVWVWVNYIGDPPLPAEPPSTQSDSIAVFRIDQSRLWAHMG